MGNFVHLHLHTEYSLLDGACRVKDIADVALKNGQTAVAITDHGVMYGAVEFYHALKNKGLHPIIGCEVYVAPRSRFLKEGKADVSGNHLILLCKNETGYRNLCYMVSQSFIEGFYQKPRIDMNLLKEHHEGLIALSACLSGKIPSLILAGSMAEAEKCVREMKELFGEDFYLEIQNHHMEEERKVVFGLKLLSDTCGVPLVATNDVHYLQKDDADLQKTLMCVQTGNTVDDPEGSFGFSTDEYYFRSTEEMENLFPLYPEAIENTLKIADKCKFDFTFGELHLPTFPPESGKTHEETLRERAYAGLEKKIERGHISLKKHARKEYEDRLFYELSVIEKMGFAAYYLIVSDFVLYAKTHNIPVGPGRGSGAGSLVAYCVEITDIDPLEFDLLFERFLNPERVSMPDFDIDFCYVRREEVIEYVKRKYGEDKVAQIVTFGTLAARAAVRSVGKALGMPYASVDKIAKMIPQAPDVTIESALQDKELRALYDSNPEVKKLLDYSRRLEGMPRNASTHAAGVVMTEKPTWEYVPLSFSGTGVVTQYDMTTDAELGLVKFDFLGLRYLTVIDDAEKMVREFEPDFDIRRVRLDDAQTYRLLKEGRTEGVFQLESAGITQVLMHMNPTRIDDIIACLALYRPGPMDSIETYIRRKNGQEPITYGIPQLAPILDVTYGCIVYQEQVMQICRTIAGYSYARADIVRRAMAKKKTEAMLAEREAFLAGAKNNGIDESAASSVFDDMVSFAKYAFNKSHAAAYAVLTYRTAYLKAHYSAQFFAALLTSVLDRTDKVRFYILNAKKYGVRVLRPDINESRSYFSVADGHIRFGLLAIRNVGRTFTETVLHERQSGGVFRSLDDFINRMCSTELNRRTLESLVKSGAFDSLGTPRSALLLAYETILTDAQERSRNNIIGQMDLFSLAGPSASVPSAQYKYPDVPECTSAELLAYEKESSGMYFSGHILDAYSTHIEKIHPDKTSDILADFSEDALQPQYRDGTEVSLGCIVTSIKQKIVKSGATMAFLKIDDSFGEMEVLVFPKIYVKFADLLTEEAALCIKGTLSEEENEAPKLLLNFAEPLTSNDREPSDASRNTEVKEAKPSVEKAKVPARLYVKIPTRADIRLQKLERMALLHPGDVEVVIFDQASKTYAVMKQIRICVDDSIMMRLSSLFGKENVVYR